MIVCRQEVEKAMGSMLKYAYVLCHDSDLACDLVQESVVKALSASQRPASEASYPSWLISILRNVFFDYLRRTNRACEVLQPADSTDIETVPTSGRADDDLLDRMAVRAGLNRISPAHRHLLVLVDVVGFSYRETAEILGVPVGTVMSRLSRARQQLRQQMAAGAAKTPVSLPLDDDCRSAG